MLQGHCFDSRLDLSHLESHHAKFQLNPLRKGRDIGCLVFRDCSAAWNPAVLQGHCFEPRLDPFHKESHYEKFQVNPLRNG